MLAGDVVSGRFEVERLCATGGMGAVHRARDRLTGEAVALKVWHQDRGDLSDRFEREAQALARLGHPGIVRYVTHGRIGDGRPFLAMEWLDGEDLSARLRRGRLRIGESLILLRRVAEALAHAHAQGLVHRDIKPSNLFLSGGAIDGVKLLDFGIAHIADGQLTRPGAVLGTPGYMAPEQIRRSPVDATRGADARSLVRIDERADVFSLGCVLYECLAGRPAFAGEHMASMWAKVLYAEPSPVGKLVPEMPVALDGLVMTMLAKDREARPRNAQVIVDALDAIDASGAGVTDEPGPSTLTDGEQQLLCVVMTSPPASAAVGPADQEARRQRISALVASLGMGLEALPSGALIATLAGRGGPSDQFARAASCALALSRLLPSHRVALASGRAVMTGSAVAGEVIDRAAAMTSSSSAGVASSAATPATHSSGVLVDDVTAGLLDARFEIDRRDGVHVLRGERPSHATVLEAPGRTLLGKTTPFVGRERELRLLESTFDECVRDSVARAVVVTAPAGAGKSRLRSELMLRLERKTPRPEVWIGRGDPMRAGSPFGMLAPAIRWSAAIREGEPIENRRQKLTERVSRRLPPAHHRRVAEFIGELVGVPFADDGSPPLRAARGDPRLMLDQMRRAWEDWLAAECSVRPMLIVLEDLHWGDQPTVAFIDAALRHLRDLPLMVIALARPEFSDLFPGLWAQRGGLEITLDALGRKASLELVRGALGEAVAPETADRIVKQAAGNAVFLEELVRAHAAGKGEALPETILAIVQRRLEALPLEARRAMRAGSVFGQSFWLLGVRSLVAGSDDKPHAVASAVLELVEQEVIHRKPNSRFPGTEEYVFRHALVREAAYGMLTDGDRTLGHRLAGEWLESAGEGDAAVLAEHAARGQERERAAGLYARAAEQALEADDLGAALARCGAGVACGATSEQLGALRLVEAETENYRANYADAGRRGLEAMALLPHASSRWLNACRQVAAASFPLANLLDLEKIGGALAAIEPDQESPTPYVVAGASVVQQLLCAGKYDLAGLLLDRVARMADAAGRHDPSVLGLVDKARGYQASFAGDNSEALTYLEASARRAQEAGNLRNAAWQQVEVAFLYLELGEQAEAERLLRDALAVAERLGLEFLVPAARQNLSLALMLRGAQREARQEANASVEAFAKQGDRRAEGWSRIYLATIELAST